MNKIINSDCIIGMKNLPDNSIDCCVTSPPYFGLRDYGHEGQIGLEDTPELFVEKMVEVFTEVKRVLKKEGTLWLNLGDSYAASGGKQVEQTVRGNKDSVNVGQNGGNRSSSNNKAWGVKQKDLIGIPWLVAFAVRNLGLYLRQDIIWHKPNPMPESVTDRCTKSHEYIFLFSKSGKYYYDADSIKEDSISVEYDERPYGIVRDRIFGYDSKQKVLRTKGGRGGFGSLNGKNNTMEYSHSNDTGKAWTPSEKRNKRSVWTVTTKPYSEAHFATFPEDLIVDCIKAGCPENGIVLDPFMGAGTTALVASKLNRNYIGFELNSEYIKIANKRLQDELGMFNKAS